MSFGARACLKLWTICIYSLCSFIPAYTVYSSFILVTLLQRSLSSSPGTQYDALNKWTAALVTLWIHEESISVPECWHSECQFMSARTHTPVPAVFVQVAVRHTQCMSSVSLWLHRWVKKIQKLWVGRRQRSKENGETGKCVFVFMFIFEKKKNTVET